MKAVGYPFSFRTSVVCPSSFCRLSCETLTPLALVIHISDQSSLHMDWMVGPEVKVPIHVRMLPVDSNIQATIILPLKQSIKGAEGSISFLPHSELDSWLYSILLRWSRSFAAIPFFMTQHVLSTYRFHIRGLIGAESRARSSKNSMYMFATVHRACKLQLLCSF